MILKKCMVFQYVIVFHLLQIYCNLLQIFNIFYVTSLVPLVL